MKKVLFLIRGLGREHRHWGDFLKTLNERFTDFEIEGLDLPGFGEQVSKRSPSTIKGISQAVMSTQVFNKYKDYDEKYILGLSLGGMVALQLMKLNPDFFTGVIIMNSSQRHKTPLLQRLNLSFLPKAFYGSLLSTVERREGIIYDMTVNSGEKEKTKAVKSWVGFYNSSPYGIKDFLRQLRAGSKFSIKGWKVRDQKGMVLTSYKDRLVSWKASRTISELMGWPLEINDNAGHDLSFDEPDWICNKLDEFIKSK